MNLPHALPDELLFSRICRYLLITGDRAEDFCSDFMGNKRFTLNPLLPSGLKEFSVKVGEKTNTLILEQTLAPFFCFFLPTYATKLRKYMLANMGAKAWRQSQLPSFSGTPKLGLNFCPQCYIEDIKNFGVHYIHRCHQTPGIVSCDVHSIRLIKLDISAHAGRLHLPEIESLQSEFLLANCIEFKVARYCKNLLSKLDAGVLSVNLVQGRKIKLRKLGYVTKRGRIRRKKLSNDFYDQVSEYRPFAAGMLPMSSSDFKYLSRLTNLRAHPHPFHQLLFSFWLFDTIDEMFKSNSLGSKDKLPDISKANIKEKERLCLKLLRKGVSLNRISALTGKSRCYLKRIASINDISVNVRPRKINGKIKDRIIKLAKSGVHRTAIAQKFQLSAGSIEQIISSVPGLVEQRKKCHFESFRRKYRMKIKRFIFKNPRAIRSDIKKQCNAAYFWLYLNDQIWLEKNLPMPDRSSTFGKKNRQSSSNIEEK